MSWNVIGDYVACRVSDVASDATTCLMSFYNPSNSGRTVLLTSIVLESVVKANAGAGEGAGEISGMLASNIQNGDSVDIVKKDTNENASAEVRTNATITTIPGLVFAVLVGTVEGVPSRTVFQPDLSLAPGQGFAIRIASVAACDVSTEVSWTELLA